LPRSAGFIFDHTLRPALSAASTAASTSASPASATSASVSSVAGFTVSNQRPDLGSTNFPPTNSG